MTNFCRGEKVWLTLSSVFGNQFTSSYGDEPNAFWESGLQQVREERLNEGLERIVNGNSPFIKHPPSLPQLLDFLKSFKGGRNIQGQLTHSSYGEKYGSSIETVDHHISLMRRMLGQKTNA